MLVKAVAWWCRRCGPLESSGSIVFDSVRHFARFLIGGVACPRCGRAEFTFEVSDGNGGSDVWKLPA